MLNPEILGSDVDWNAVLLYGVPAWIAACGGAIAAILGARNQRNLRTSNGKTVAEAVEQTHTVVSENAAALEILTQQASPEAGNATA